jgi:hypothetical protein
LALQAKPELRTIAEVPAKAHRYVGRNRTMTIENIGMSGLMSMRS